jgi:hypothetical protein
MFRLFLPVVFLLLVIFCLFLGPRMWGRSKRPNR